ncbi:MAG: phosphonate metabolism protein/1,5-bisphosphokinase (PRPP-forming) PhnN [Neomegalonema sp.]|nr:phosphonate metabolism protein/1,5-bisphosphokinase (PRPP-forming) PhnN [Neomegalonema sp.]
MSAPAPIPPAPRRSVLHLVVGPSGAGKDTLIDAVRAIRPDILIGRRVITRAEDAGGEEHEAISEEEFEARRAAGGFALWWRAHGLSYGAPAALIDALDRPQHVLLNVSRRIVAEAQARFAPVRVLQIWAPQEVLAARLAARGRESEADILERLRRKAGATLEDGPNLFRIDNSGAREDGVASMLSALAPRIPPPLDFKRRKSDVG